MVTNNVLEGLLDTGYARIASITVRRNKGGNALSYADKVIPASNPHVDMKHLVLIIRQILECRSFWVLQVEEIESLGKIIQLDFRPVLQICQVDSVRSRDIKTTQIDLVAEDNLKILDSDAKPFGQTLPFIYDALCPRIEILLSASY